MRAANQRFKSILKIFSLPALLLASACTLAPVYERPESPVPGSFPEYHEYKGIEEASRYNEVPGEISGEIPGSQNVPQPEAAPKIIPDSVPKHLIETQEAWTDEKANPVKIEQSARENAWNGAEALSAKEAVKNTGQPGIAVARSVALPANGVGRPAADKILNAGDVEVEIDEIPGAGNLRWQDFFTDQTMQRLIALALENNRDLRMALLNIEKARAMYQIQQADLLPSIQASGVNSNQRVTAEMSPTHLASISRQNSVSVGFTSFELDIFGRVRSLRDAALENFFALTQNAHSAQVSLISEIAATYLTLVSYNELYALTEDSYQSRKKSFELAKNLFEQGLSSQMALNQARTEMDQARVDAVQFRTTALRYENALRLLLGASLPADTVIPKRLAEMEKLKDVPEGLPSYLMERRPDILAAEHRLKSANANIGAARASFFPRISLTGSLGTISGDMDNLFESASRTWSFAPSISIPIFEAGRLRANLRVSEADQKLAVAAYEKSIQTAFREVADALAFRSTSAEQVASVTSFVNSARQSYELSTLRYEVGVDSFVNVLDSQRIYFAAQQAYVNTMLNCEINTLNLYKALGGGWE
jgi:multidrug efflux system outer membrane protein